MSNTVAPQTTATSGAEQQGTHQYLLTLQVPVASGFSISSWAGTYTPTKGATRHDVYQKLRAEITRSDSRWAGASVLLFDLQPNNL